MSGAVISSNVSLRVNAAVFNSITTNAVLHTPPANSYSIVQISYVAISGAAPRVTLGGQNILSFVGASSTGWNNLTNTISPSQVSTFTNIYVGPGQVLEVFDGLAFGGFRMTVTGVNFINSP